MLLHINKNNIKYIIYNQKTRFDTNVEDASLTDLVRLKDFGDTEHSYIWYVLIFIVLLIYAIRMVK